MSSHEFVFTKSAAETFKELIEDLQTISLLSAEKIRSRIMHKLHLIQHQPMQSSKKVDIGIDGHFRLATVLNYKIFYKLEEGRIIVVDLLTDKDKKSL